MAPHAEDPPLLRMIDLFSGIGGFSLALEGVCVPVIFCDRNDEAKNVLLDAMKTGRRDGFACFPRAPITDDVKELAKRATLARLRADVVCAGFPCQDISPMNIRGEGIWGERSCTVFQALHIARASGASAVFLENSPYIRHRGLDTLMRHLVLSGYDRIRWGIFSAEEVGAPHQRKRFYLLAARDGAHADRVLTTLNRRLSFSSSSRTSGGGRTCACCVASDASFWARRAAPCPVVPKTPANLRALKNRGFLLGNAIVPQCARHACAVLTRHVLSPSASASISIADTSGQVEVQQEKKLTETTKKENIPDGKNVGSEGVDAFRVPVVDSASAISSTSSPPSHRSEDFDCRIKMCVPASKITPPDGKNKYCKIRLATPLATWWFGTKIGSERASQILPNQILYDCRVRRVMKERGRPDPDAWLVNPEFAEWMMGYPRGWTKAWDGVERKDAARGRAKKTTNTI